VVPAEVVGEGGADEEVEKEQYEHAPPAGAPPPPPPPGGRRGGAPVRRATPPRGRGIAAPPTPHARPPATRTSRSRRWSARENRALVRLCGGKNCLGRNKIRPPIPVPGLFRDQYLRPRPGCLPATYPPFALIFSFTFGRWKKDYCG